MGNIKKVKTIKIDLSLTIEVRTLEDFMYSVGSGTRYWAESRLEYESCVKSLLRGNTIAIYDYIANEDDPKGKKIKYRLDLDKVKVGIQRMALKQPKFFAELLNGDYDSLTGDVFLQLAIFDELIYG